ncbi:ribonuclease III [Egbenema bharatensis]|uniref:ribonuclease III n=1 Tax=Egbenema bharatensis TaxID=3463334 RepID=UPI003A8BE599
MNPSFQLPRFHDRSLLELALTHRSYVNEHPAVREHNERLEFLGDAILNFLSGEYLYKKFPEKPEGQLSAMRSSLVDERQLAQFAEMLGLGSQIKLGRGAEQEGGRHNANLLSSTFEAIVGAYFLDTDSDIAAVQDFVEPLFDNYYQNYSCTDSPSDNPKSQFQAWALATIGVNPQYEVIREIGPDHAKEFTAIVQVKQQTYGQGQGRRKQEAEKAAARDALKRLGL